jgi:phage terminase Nu1 subunit (DNA packaging protein)
LTDTPTFKSDVIAKLCGLSDIHLRRLVKDGILSKPQRRGAWPISMVTEYIEYLRDISTTGTMDARAHKLRLLIAQADKAEMEIAEKQGEVVDVAQVGKIWGGLVDTVKKKVLAMGPKLGPLVANESKPVVCRDIIDKVAHDALTEISEYDPDSDRNLSSGVKAGGDGGPKRGKAAAKTDNKRVGGRGKKVKSRGKRRAGKVDNRKG